VTADVKNFTLELSVDHAQVTPQMLYKLYDSKGRVHRETGGKTMGAFSFDPNSTLEIKIHQLDNGAPAPNPVIVENLHLIFAANLISKKGPGPVNPDPKKLNGQEVKLKPVGSAQKQIVKMQSVLLTVAGAWQVSGTLSLKKDGLSEFTFDPEVIVGRRE